MQIAARFSLGNGSVMATVSSLAPVGAADAVPRQSRRIRKILRAIVPFLLGGLCIYWRANSYTRVWSSFMPPVLYWKDCISPFLMAKAVIHGVNPYLSLQQLAALWLKEAHPANHPTPHPPFVALLSLPLSAFSYPALAHVWLGLEVLYVLIAIILILYWWRAPLNPLKIALFLALAVLWMPLNEELWQGQFMTFLMLLSICAWLALRSGKEATGGALIGSMIAVKMMGAPIVLFYLLQRRWRIVFGAAAVVVSANVLAMLVLGPSVVIDYYRNVGPLNAKLWRPAEGNLSAWAWGVRLFAGSGFSYTVSPLWPSPKLTAFATYFLPLAVLALALTCAWRARSFDIQFSWLMAAIILFSPITWYFYLLLAVIPMAVLARRLCSSAAPAEVWALALLFWSLISIWPLFTDHIVRSYGYTVPKFGRAWSILPFSVGLLTLLPTFGLFGLMWMLSRTDDPPRSRSITTSSPTRPF